MSAYSTKANSHCGTITLRGGRSFLAPFSQSDTRVTWPRRVPLPPPLFLKETYGHYIGL